jgi:flavorubredoxin
VCHHSDPDIAAGLPLLRTRLSRPDIELVTEWRAQTLLHHYHAGFPHYLVEEHDWKLPLDDGRELRFVLTPYLHFPGAMCSWERTTGVLFSSDIFGGFTDGTDLAATPATSRRFVRSTSTTCRATRSSAPAWRRSFRPITMIAPSTAA